MFFSQERIANNHNVNAHWANLWANRRAHDDYIASTFSIPAVNSQIMGNSAFATDFWKELDRTVVTSFKEVEGYEILQDLMQIETVVPIGKTVKDYPIRKAIANDVAVSVDGNAPYSKDHTGYDTDGDPSVIVTAGFGANWRHVAGLNTIGIDLVLDSQQEKSRVYNEKLVDILLNGDNSVVVDGKECQGLKNHRNTKKINLGSSGSNIDLTSATAAEMLAFYTKGAFYQNSLDNRIRVIDVEWVSPQIWANLQSDYVVNGVIKGSIWQEIVARGIVGEFRMTFALDGNETLGYVRQAQYLTVLNGMTTSITPVPRKMPNDNYDFQMMSAMGVQVKRDRDGLGKVVYCANFG